MTVVEEYRAAGHRPIIPDKENRDNATRSDETHAGRNSTICTGDFREPQGVANREASRQEVRHCTQNEKHRENLRSFHEVCRN